MNNTAPFAKISTRIARCILTRRAARLSCALVAALTFSIAFSLRAASAASFTVNSLGDGIDVAPADGKCAAASGECTLRAAMQEANALPSSDTINFAVTGTINLTGPLPDITTTMTISGPGSGLLTVRRDTGGDYRIFFVNNSSAIISGMTITNGKTADGASDPATVTSGGSGGGIQAFGSLTLTDVVVTGNRTGSGGAGGINDGRGGGWGGGIASSGTLTMTNVIVSNNVAGKGGDGFYGGGGGFGGGLYFTGTTLTMTNCRVTGNVAGDAGLTTSGAHGTRGGDGGGVYASNGTLNLTNVTISSNTSGNGYDGGWGGGLFTLTNVISNLRDCIVSDNNAGGGQSGKFGAEGGIGGGIFNAGQMAMLGCLVSGNATRAQAQAGAVSAGESSTATC